MEKYFKVKIINHTPILLGNIKVGAWHEKMVGMTIWVKNVDWPSAYYEAKTGESILKTDCKTIKL